MRFDDSNRGFTLVELLVAAALSVLITLIVTNIMIDTNKLTSNSVNQASRIDDIQGISSLIGDDVRASKGIYDNLTVPSWVDIAGGSKALTLRYPLVAPCNTANDISYIVYPRSVMTASGISQWLKLPDDPSNSTRQVLVRAELCNTTESYRLVADYVESFTFKLAMEGETNFRDSGLTANAGIPFRSVEFQYAASRSINGTLQRVPRTGTLRTVATARAP